MRVISPPLTVLAFLILLQPLGCQRIETDEGSEPDRQAPIEAGLRLTEEARASIGVVTTPVRAQIIPSNISTSGWLAVKPGHEITIKAVATGFIILGADDELVSLGDAVTVGQRLGELRVFVSPTEEAQLVALKEEADIRIRQSLASLETATARLERTEQLSDSGTIPGKEKQLAEAAVKQAQAAYEETQQQLPFLPSEPFERPLQLGASEIKSPIAGRVVKLHVRPRQLVIQGEPLWTISDWSSLWLRVPTFEGDLPRIDQTQPAALSTPGLESPMAAAPTGIPQPTEDGRRTVDLFYEVANTNGKLRPGEAISVELPTDKPATRIVAPRSAILWDGMANAWVYLEVEDNRFRRQRIQIGSAAGDVVVVQHGLTEGQRIVTTGAEALYGEEFKGQFQVLEDDD